MRLPLHLMTIAAVAVLTAPLLPATAAPVVPPEPHRGDLHRTGVAVFAHRGASGYRPEHTLEAYRLAIAQGADVIEPDVVSTRDGVLVARHENEISGTTDVAAHPEFADRRTTRTIDGVTISGWFTEDFTLAELKTLRAVERLPQLRPANTLYDGRFEIPTLDEVIDLARSESRRLGRTIRVAPETKHPTYFASIGLGLSEPLLTSLRRVGWDRRSAPVVVQSFETTNLRQLARRTRVPLAQLVAASGAPYDLLAAGDRRTYADLVSPEGLKQVAGYATWVAPEKSMVLPRDAVGATGTPSRLVDDAHRAGLEVVVYTVRAENLFLPTNHRIGDAPAGIGDVAAELRTLFDAGVDGVFADQVDLAVAARQDWLARRPASRP